MIRSLAAGLSAIVLLTGFAAAPALAQQPKALGDFGDWTAYAYSTKKGKVCYIVSQPKSSLPSGANRDPVFFLVTHRTAEKVHNEVNTIIGYPFKKGSSVELSVDGNAHKLFTSGDGAWADSSATDNRIVEAMKAGKSMVVKGTSQRGTDTTDTYSLSGVTAAMDKIDETCK